MKVLIVRTIAVEEDCSQSTYNNQGIGLATELSKLGHECGLVYYAKRGNRKIEAIQSDGEVLTVYHIEGRNIVWNAIYNEEIYEIAAQYDVIQTAECDQIATWMMYRRFPHKTIVYHGPYKSQFTIKYNLRSHIFDIVFSSRGDFKKVPVIAKSFLAEKYLNSKGFCNTVTLGVGLNPSVLQSDCTADKGLVKRLKEERKKKKYILYVGAISKRKNLIFIINILKKLVKEEQHKNYKLLIIGGKAYKEEKYFEECFKVIKDNGLDEYVDYLGVVKQRTISQIYKLCDVFVLPTQYDIFGMVYLEALYFGVPIVTSLCGGSSLLIKNGDSGFICKLGDISFWSSKIIDILENQEMADSMRRKGQQLIQQGYTWEKLAPKFAAEYQKLL